MTGQKLRALIADDEPLLAADLATRLAVLWPELEVAAVVHNGPAAVEALARLAPDIAFLDIRMPGLSGLEVAQQTRVPHLVFVTAYDQYALAAFESAAADYLLKPVSDTRLAQTIERLRQRVETTQAPSDVGQLLQQLLGKQAAQIKWIRASVGNDTHLVDVDEVIYFRADEKYTVVQTAQRDYLIRTPLRELLPQLDGARFWQVHRNTIVATSAISSARRELNGRVTLSLRGRSETLSVSRAFAHLFKQM
ncbi:LytTR family DNA-binding domain-containing protein [Uliginosibacterium sp. H3]|uniref:LytTR family DNA-binding domain-containing protein n=1 Tax=Uliginosibacterium silvisoli TaxID=3114758 RepID=A0ABU6K785_9RHOO|nr:LytTR family DNA-binding domain-containing protein [Uliginosibacterium sp. H3]